MRIESPATLAVISDTHGMISPEALSAIEAIEPSVIVHAGDIGAHAILLELEAIAPVVAVRGNTDGGAWAGGLPDTGVLHVGDTRLMVVHDSYGYVPNDDTDVLVSGHAHVASVARRDGCLHVNPGSVTRPRATDRVPTFAVIEIAERDIRARIIRL